MPCERSLVEAIQAQRKRCCVYSLDAYPDAAMRLDIALRQALAACDESPWRSMESAPKDGTEILGFREDAGAFIMAWMCPSDMMTEREIEEFGMGEYAEINNWFGGGPVTGEWMEGNEAPTHWMPLPAAPEGKP